MGGEGVDAARDCGEEIEEKTDRGFNFMGLSQGDGPLQGSMD